MKTIKNVFINLTITAAAVYLPLLAFSTYSEILRKNTSKARIERINKKRIPAIKNGYLPFYIPSEIKSKVKKTGFYPIGSLPFTKTYYCDEGYGLIKYITDRFGLRNKDEVWVNIKNQPNIFLIGDSFGQGACVPSQNTITSNIKESTNINSINLASSANSPYEYHAILKTILNPILLEKSFKNWVILLFYNNDDILHNQDDFNKLNSAKSIIFENNNGNISPKESYIKELSNIIKTNYPTSQNEIINKLQNKYGYGISKKNLKESFLYKVLTLVPIRSSLYKLKSLFERKISPTEKSIAYLAETCKENCTPIVAYIPSHRNKDPYLDPLRYKKLLREFSLKYKIKFIDSEGLINPNSSIDYSPEGAHLSIVGYRKIGNLISDAIKSEK